MWEYMEFKDLEGKIFTQIDVDRNNLDHGDNITFITDNGEEYELLHRQDCCEDVSLEDINGNLDDILNQPILLAEEVFNSHDLLGKDPYESFTWTFYKLATNKGYVNIRWYGQSSGYYSEIAELIRTK